MNKKVKNIAMISSGMVASVAIGFAMGCLKEKYYNTTKCIIDELGPLV